MLNLTAVLPKDINFNLLFMFLLFFPVAFPYHLFLLEKEDFVLVL